ncbi:MAG: DUF2497 domain-containing protein [Alphaproteobacteria bacterium]|nr:DUF2497 domain-containing protein [Alphaproteobacteria bacterium]
MASDKPNSEPSMEEILASIRRIISEETDEQGAAAGNGDEVLELTEVVEDLVAAVPDAPAAEPKPTPAPPAAAPAAAPPPPEVGERDRLVSDFAANMASSRFSALARAAEPDPLEGVQRTGRTVEEIAVDLLRPMLKEWLDTNVPSIVERMVEREIRYLSRRNDNE